jgi:pimeloyl-ACP methyl ester carboxylesterase
MELALHTAGDGPRTALLIHGLVADHGTWHAVEADLLARGYRVLAPDLRGHGHSERSASYRLADFADDLVQTLPAGADLAIGHSLGGLVLSRAVGRLRPGRAVYYDPAFVLPQVPPRLRAQLADMMANPSRDSIESQNPRWSQADLDAEMAALALFDQSVAIGLLELTGKSFLPEGPEVPSLVMLADPSVVVPPDAAALLRGRGFEVVTVAGAGHCIHRDDLAGFVRALDGWL